MGIYYSTKDIEKQSYLKFFFEWVDKFIAEKPFDLSKSAEEVNAQFVERYLKGDFKRIKVLANAILKSYVPERYEEIKGFVSTADLSIINYVGLIEKFALTICPESVLPKEPVKNSEELKKFLGEIVAENLVETMGDALYVRSMTLGEMDTKTHVKDALRERGFQQFSKKLEFFLREQTGEKDPASNQDLLLSIYCSVVNDYIKNYSTHTKKRSKKENFEQIWNVVEIFLAEAEQKMTAETIQNPIFVKAKEATEWFFGNVKERLYSTDVYEGNRGEYYLMLSKALKHKKDDCATPEDDAVIVDFCHKIENLNRALSIVDAEGNNYPVNYFKCMPIHPSNIIECMTKLDAVGSAYEEFDRKTLVETKTLISKTMMGMRKYNSGDRCDVSDVLKEFRMKYERGEFSIDLTDDKQFSQFIGDVDKIIEENELPRNEMCIWLVGRDLFRGRKTPVKVDSESGKIKDM